MVETGKLAAALPEAARGWLEQALTRVYAEPATLPVLFPQLPRRLGRTVIGQGLHRQGDALVDGSAWRACDTGALELIRRARATDDAIVDLFEHGDLEERAMVLRSLGLLPVTAATLRLLEEVQRTNTVSWFEAALCESNLASRALSHPDFHQPAFNRLILKLAFLDLPLDRVLDAERHANPELGRMLAGLASERRAAGRPVWADTGHLIARCAPDS